MAANSKYLTAALAALILLTGCVSGVKRYDSAAAASANRTNAATQLRNVSLTMNQEAQAKAGDNLQFSPDALLATVKRALDTKNLLAKEDDPALPRMEIVLTDFRVRSTIAAVVLGIMAGTDSVAGDVILRDANGQEFKKYEVSASYGLGGVAGAIEEVRVGWLYDKFAEHTLAELDLAH